MDPTRARASRRRGRARRTQQQIRQQTLPVWNVHVSNGLRVPADAQDVQTFPPLTDILQEDCGIQDPAEGNTTHGPVIGSSGSGDLGHFRVLAAAERGLDLEEGIDIDHGGESDPEEFEDDIFVDFESSEKNEPPNNRFSTSFIEHGVPDVECTALEQRNIAPTDSSIRKERLVKWQSIFALLVTCGTVRMTVQQYKLIYSLHAWASSKDNLPSIKTVQRNLMPAIRDFSYAQCSYISLRTKDAKRSDARTYVVYCNTGGTTADDSICPDKEKQSVVRIVLPSE
jgi:hypothetical protein